MVARKLRASIPYILLIVITAPIIISYGWLFMSSFVTKTEGIIPKGDFTLDSWKFLKEPLSTIPGVEMPNIWRITLNTLIFALFVALAEVSISAAAAYALSRLKFWGRERFLMMTIILHSFPSVTLLIAIFFVLRYLHLYDNILGIILVKLSLDLPLGIWIMKGFFDNVSWDIEMAALIDGCGRFRTWWQVMLPLIKPGIAALAIFAFLSGWSEFILPFIFTTSFSNWTLSVLIRRLIGDFRFVDYGRLTAVGLFYILPVLFFFIFTQEYLLNIYTGGVKG